MSPTTDKARRAGQGGVVFTALMPHAPVLVPNVGRDRLSEVARTVKGMQEVSARLQQSHPDVVVLVSPHSPRRPGAFGVWEEERLAGSLERFGDATSRVQFPVDRDFISALKAETSGKQLEFWAIPGWEALDHGAVVPLWFVQAAGWTGPTVVFGLNYPGEGSLEELGRALAAVARQQGKRLAVVASGDMSHRLKPGAPAGYEPQARDFDHAFIELVRAGHYREMPRMDAALQELAAEDVVDSSVIAAAAADWHAGGHEVLSYEGPFGVGYGVAVLFDAGKTGAQVKEPTLPEIARESVTAALGKGSAGCPELEHGPLSEQRAVFVTLRECHGELRGCIGTLSPKFRTVAEETWNLARSAALHDTRFSPVEPRELSGLRFEVSVLEPLEATKESDLDPARYGVVVSTEDGRRGVLLPGIEGVRTVRQQLEIARRKGHIEPNETVQLQRFLVTKHKEPGFVEAD